MFSRVISRFAGEVTAETEPDKRNAPTVEPDSSAILWPTGPSYDRPIKAKKLKAWAKYKMEAADWYLDTLLAMLLQKARLERVLGVEMAVEGVIQSLCSAFEVMICALTQSIEKAAGVPADHRTPRHLVSWSRLAAAAKVFDIDLATRSPAFVRPPRRALRNPGKVPSLSYWFSDAGLTVARSLVEAASSDGGDDELLIDVPGVAHYRSWTISSRHEISSASSSRRFCMTSPTPKRAGSIFRPRTNCASAPAGPRRDSRARRMLAS